MPSQKPIDVHLHLPPALVRKLTRKANREGTDASAAIRRAVESDLNLAHQKRRSRQSKKTTQPDSPKSASAAESQIVSDTPTKHFATSNAKPQPNPHEEAAKSSAPESDAVNTSGSINYGSPPDLDHPGTLTVDRTALFHRFHQSADLTVVDQRWMAEVRRHIELCELAILWAAGSDCFWCRLPPHPLQDINMFAMRHLENVGFRIHNHEEVETKKVHVEGKLGSKQPVFVVDSYSTVSWSVSELKNETSAEFTRRIALERDFLAENKPRRLSSGSGNHLKRGNAVWAGTLARKYIIEVQRRLGRAKLCLFDLKGTLIHCEKTYLLFGATAGADDVDIEGWRDRAATIVSGLRKHPKIMSSNPILNQHEYAV